MKNKLVIIGCGGHARSVADVYLLNNPKAEIVFFHEDAKENEFILGFPALNKYKIDEEQVFIAIGDNIKRKNEAIKYKELQSIISKNAYIGRNVSFDKGVFIANMAHVGVNSKLGSNTIINTATVIDHDVIIGENCHIAPNSTICGRVKIGNNVLVGAGSVIIDKINICDDVIIGAGAVVIKNINVKGTYVGNPLRKVK